MLDFSHLAELSRLHCLGICAFLVPSNLLATLTTLGVVGMEKPPISSDYPPLWRRFSP